jgi:Uma2 family endonuclease
MSTAARTHQTPGEPTWDIAKLFPAQGAWSEEEYLALPGNHLVELSDGSVDVLPMPTYAHQLLVAFLYRALCAYLAQHPSGRVIFAPLRVKLGEGKFREPDIVFMSHDNAHRIHNAYWDGADLVMEVMSPDDPLRDARTKRREYAEAGIPEYWLVNPMEGNVTVFTLDEVGEPYRVHGIFFRKDVATSILLSEFTLDADLLFAEVEDQQM